MSLTYIRFIETKGPTHPVTEPAPHVMKMTPDMKPPRARAILARQEPTFLGITEVS